MSAERQPFSFAGAGGVEIRGESRQPPGPARAQGLLVHGFAEHLGRYSELTEELLAAGYGVHRFDLRGHGRSGGRRGHVADFAHYGEDLDEVLRRVVEPSRSAGSPPPFVLAHSLGGLLVLERFTRPSPPAVSSLVISGPYLAPAFSVPRGTSTLLRLVRYLPGVRLPAGLDAEGLSRDPAVVQAYRDDPLVFGHLSPDWFLQVEAAQERVAAAAGRVTPPCLMLLGEADPVADPAQGRRVFERLGSASKRLRTYPDFRHEVLNEVGRERVVADVLAWLDATVGAGDDGTAPA